MGQLSWTGWFESGQGQCVRPMLDQIERTYIIKDVCASEAFNLWVSPVGSRVNLLAIPTLLYTNRTELNYEMSHQTVVDLTLVAVSSAVSSPSA